MRELYNLFGGRFGVSQTGAEYGLRSTWADFSSNKSVPANMKKGFYTSQVPKNEDIGVIFVFSSSEL
jgi:hypothetical protein